MALTEQLLPLLLSLRTIEALVVEVSDSQRNCLEKNIVMAEFFLVFAAEFDFPPSLKVLDIQITVEMAPPPGPTDAYNARANSST